MDRNELFQIARRIAARIFLCNIHDDAAADRALKLLDDNQDCDISAEDLGLITWQPVALTLSASDIEEITSISHTYLHHLSPRVAITETPHG